MKMNKDGLCLFLKGFNEALDMVIELLDNTEDENFDDLESYTVLNELEHDIKELIDNKLHTNGTVKIEKIERKKE